MKIIISPAKTMIQNTDTFSEVRTPVFLEEAKELSRWMKGKTREELQRLWECSDKLTDENILRLKRLDVSKGQTPAILAYEGIQYQYMAPVVFEESSFQYVEEHLRILSGLYGILRPFDGVSPYRMEMQAKVTLKGKNLYEFWKDAIYKELIRGEESPVILNLASKEYSQCIVKYLTLKDHMVSCKFVEEVNGAYKQKATYAKMARGEMVRFLAQNQVEDLDGVKKFHGLEFHYEESLSGEKELVFVRKRGASS